MPSMRSRMDILVSEIGLDDPAVGGHDARGALRDLLPEGQHDDPVREGHDGPHVVLDEEDGDPPALMAPMSRTMASISVALSPAITSSSKRSVGSVASARASSSRLRSARVRREASSEARSTSATRSRTARAAASASAMAGWRASAATLTLSSTESRAK